MTNEQWLNTALAGLAPRVRDRLHREYEAHMLDMQEAGEPDWAIAAAFGDPLQLNRELREKYLTEWEAGVVANRSRLWTPRTKWMPLVMGCAGLLLHVLLNILFGGNLNLNRWWFPVGVGFLGTLWLLYLSRTVPARQLPLKGSMAMSYLLMVLFVVIQSLNFSSGWESTALLLGLGTLLFLWIEFGLNGQLHRKLSAEDSLQPVKTPHSR